MRNETDTNQHVHYGQWSTRQSCEYLHRTITEKGVVKISPDRLALSTPLKSMILRRVLHSVGSFQK